MLDPSQYNVGIAAEDIRQYCAGGYHPVHLHDHFKDGRYEVLDKLGFGAFATVWLAKDHVTQRNVSLKIVIANGLEKQNHELNMLQHVQANDLHSRPGRSSVTHLLDSFFHDGPNGRHLCMVLELLGPSVSWVAEKSQNRRMKADLARHFSAQIIQAVASLHRCGVVHGDIHMGNILLRLPAYAGAAGSLNASGSPHTGQVSKKDGSPLEKGVPEYLVKPLEYDVSALDLDSGDVQLVDFGSAFFASSPPTMIYTPFSLYPPELVFKRPLTQAVDIWNLGCTLYQLALGRTLFEVGFDPRELIPQYGQVLGGVPAEWLDGVVADGVLDEEHEDSTNDFLPLEEKIQRAYVNGHPTENPQLTKEDLERLGKYLRKMLVVAPQHRATAAELASDTSWILVA